MVVILEVPRKSSGGGGKSQPRLASGPCGKVAAGRQAAKTRQARMERNTNSTSALACRHQSARLPLFCGLRAVRLACREAAGPARYAARAQQHFPFLCKLTGSASSGADRAFHNRGG